MTDQSETPTGQQAPGDSIPAAPADATPAPADAIPAPAEAIPAPAEPTPPPSDAAPASSGSSGGGPAAIVHDRPEVAVGAAFAGGLLLALTLKRIAS